MGVYTCPKNPKHTLKTTDNDDRFEELTCVSCGSRIYKPKQYDQSPIVEVQSGIDLIPEDYTIWEDVQEDIDDEEKAFNLMCTEATKYYTS